MAILLEGLFPRLFPELPFQCVPHRGKNDLHKSVPRKLKAWREPRVMFVVMRDQDQADCRDVKRELREACRQGGRCDALVRVVCRELEAWYIGEPEALAQAFPCRAQAVKRALGRARYRDDPDGVAAPAEAIGRLIPQFGKRAGAERMARFLSRCNTSRSFHALLEGIERLQPAMRCRNG